MAEYEEKLYDVIEVPAGDSLIAGGCVEVGVIKLTTAGEYKRGEVLMSSGDSFVKATSAGLSSAEEIVIMCNDLTFEDGDEGELWVYVSGRFNQNSLVYDESIEIADLESAMRKHKIFLR